MRRVLALLLVAACSSGDASTAPPSSRDAGSPAKDAAEKTTDAKKPVDAARPKDAGHDVAHDAPLEGGDAAPPVGQWTWVDIPGAVCLNGTPTGIAINPAPTPSDDVVMFFEGGGACWDGTTCWGPTPSASFTATGYGETQFDDDLQAKLFYILDRTNAQNPFANMNLVFLPYCTGDVFLGNNVTSLAYEGTSHATSFVGYADVSLYLSYIAVTYPKANHVWVTGVSAGGFGAGLNFTHVQDALPNAKVEVLDDSGQPIEPAPGVWNLWSTAWNAQLPADCPGCKTDPGAFVAYYSGKYPTQRYGLISFANDTVIGPFMELTPQQFNTELLALAANMTANWPNGHYFIIDGASHVGLIAPSPQLMTWVSALVTEDPSWTSETLPGDAGL